MQMEIVTDDLRGPEIAALLQSHLELMRSQSPACSVHALDLDALRTPQITFWSAWLDGDLLGCVALKTLNSDHGEIKSMHTAKAARGRGIAAKMLIHLEQHARACGIDQLSLETGSQDGFEPARTLYSKFGYAICPPFGDYVPDSNSTFMTKSLSS